MSYQASKSVKNASRNNNKADRSLSSLEYSGIKFPVSKKDYGRIEKKSNIWINVFADENGLAYPVHVRDKKFEDCIYQGF